MVDPSNPYSPPATAQSTIHPAQPRATRSPPTRLLLASAATFGLTVLGLTVINLGSGAGEMPNRVVGGAGFGLATVLALVGAGRGIWSIAARFSSLGAKTVGLLVAVVVANGAMAFVGAVGTLLSLMQFRRGRQLRRFGRVLLPPVEPGDAWAKSGMAVAVDDGVRRALAAQWRENGRTEHASVAAFARLTSDLLALGAPPSLVAAAQRDALDEIRHTELCFALARGIDGEAAGPGAFAEAGRGRAFSGTRTMALARLAVDSLIDGALHEGVSARVIARLARRAESGVIRDILKEIARDEGRHAAHGWDVVEWCVSEGKSPVVAALRGSLAVLPEQMHSALPAAAEGGAWERFGIHGRALEAEEYANARRELVRRVEALAAGWEAARATAN